MPKRVSRRVGTSLVAALGMVWTGLAAVSTPVAASPGNATATPFAVVNNSLPATTDRPTGGYTSSRMSIEVSLAPRDAAGLAKGLAAVYSRTSNAYHRWLSKGQFDATYAPTAATRAAVAAYLRSAGLTVGTSSSPFLVRAAGSSAKVAAAFRTTLSTYRNKTGTTYYSNSAAVQLPASLSAGVEGVIGLSNTIRARSMVQRAALVARPARSTTKKTSCETPYPTTAQLYNAVNNGVGFPFGYGAGPGCSGLTPSQTNSIYGAPNVGARGKGASVTMAVFELSGYQQSDIAAYVHQFYGAGYNAPLVDVNVDGGPLNPACPDGDTCPAQYNGYAGDIEVDADIETQLAVAPDASSLIVYNAPNDYTGQTELDEYTAIATADQAAVVSSSWAECENDVSAGYAQAENTVFEQMALQGQSMFGAEGDTGAFSCIRSDGTTILNVLDPPSQPWVTSVGGTSLESDNPGLVAHPGYPNGKETVWNVDSLCNTSADEGGQSGLFWCSATGAGGGGSSEYWGRPFYQVAKGVDNANTTVGNGGTQCQLATTGTPCREDPDISANADEYTPYAEYCTAIANTNSQCGFSADQAVPGWFGIGGTSLSSPVWSAITADRDSYQRFRTGNINPLLYLLDNIAPATFFHDITGKGQSTKNNGAFPTTPGYDEATGIGTPKMKALITGRL